VTERKKTAGKQAAGVAAPVRGGDASGEPGKPARPARPAQEQRDRAKQVALRRLREAPDEELAVFEDRLRADALAAGASEQELRQAQSGHPGHS